MTTFYIKHIANTIKKYILMRNGNTYKNYLESIYMETEEKNTNQSPSTPSEGGASNTQSTTQSTSTEKIENKTLMAILAYLSILIIIPYLTSKDDPFVKYHIKQGAVLLVIELIVWFAGTMIWGLYPLLMLVNVATLALSIIGILNVLNGKEKELPLVGQFSKNFNI